MATKRSRFERRFRNAFGVWPNESSIARVQETMAHEARVFAQHDMSLTVRMSQSSAAPRRHYRHLQWLVIRSGLIRFGDLMNITDRAKSAHMNELAKSTVPTP